MYLSARVPAPIKRSSPCFLLFTRLIEVRELWLFECCDLFVLVGLVVEFESVIGINEILLYLFFHPIIYCDPIKKFSSVFLIFGPSRIVVLESLVVSVLFFLRDFVIDSSYFLHKIITTNKSNCVEHSPAGHNSSAKCHCVLRIHINIFGVYINIFCV